MGPRITAVFQKRDGARWIDVPSDYDEDDDIALFEWLGAGGGARGSFDIEPLAAHRGAPDGFELVNGGTFHPVASIDIHAPSKRLLQARLQKVNGGAAQVCMGSPDIRWLQVDDILAATPPRMTRTVGVARAFFEAWDGKALPDRWDLLAVDWKQRPPAAPGVYARSYEIGDNTKYVAVDRDFDFADEFRYFLDELRALKSRHGDVRMVYAFY
ncbi:MAG: hypothetical protein ABJD97_17510 [Betaproteobacteria bacterium]